VDVGRRSYTARGFKSELDAAIARDRLALHFFGSRARLNFPDRRLKPASPEGLARIAGRNQPRKSSAAIARDRLASFVFGNDARLNFSAKHLTPASPELIRTERRAERKRLTTSPYRGVVRGLGRERPWNASVKVKGRAVWLGSWRTDREAAIAVDRAALFYRLGWRDLNFPALARTLKPMDPIGLRAKAHAPFKKRTKSRYRGVKRAKSGRWVVMLVHQGKIHYAGTFDREQDAARAYDREALRLHGHRARLNFPETARRVQGTRSPTPTRSNAAVKRRRRKK
jgi:hypothetical protein